MGRKGRRQERRSLNDTLLRIFLRFSGKEKRVSCRRRTVFVADEDETGYIYSDDAKVQRAY